MSSADTSTAQQLPLTLRYPPDQALDTFVGAPAGALAQLHVLASTPGADWLYLRGVAGCGKTHLALAVCAAAEVAGRRAAYLPARTASGRLREALQALEGADVIALDGVEAIAGRHEDEIALFDFHNRARSAGSAVLYTARDAPDALPLDLPDLRSRLAQCTHLTLVPVDGDGRHEVLRQRARRRGLGFDEAVIAWLFNRTGRDLSNLTSLLERLDRASLAAQRRITVPFLRETLGPSRRDTLGPSRRHRPDEHD